MFADKKVARRSSSLVLRQAPTQHCPNELLRSVRIWENNYGQLGEEIESPCYCKIVDLDSKYIPAKPVLISASGFHSLVHCRMGQCCIWKYFKGG